MRRMRVLPKGARGRAVLLGAWICVAGPQALIDSGPQARAEGAPFIALGRAASPIVAAPAAPAAAFAPTSAPAPDPAAAAVRSRAGSGSLFAGTGAGALFAPWPKRVPRVARTAPQPGPGSALTAPAVWQAAQLRHLIARAEAGRDGYDAVQHGARIKPPALPTRMTVAEIYAWIDATPGQPHAIGRYQFIPATLRRLVRQQRVPLSAQFSPQVQDLLADALLHEAGFTRLARAEISRETFMHNLARIWAGLPTASGKSYYEGYAGNSATMTRRTFEREMARIFGAS